MQREQAAAVAKAAEELEAAQRAQAAAAAAGQEGGRSAARAGGGRRGRGSRGGRGARGGGGGAAREAAAAAAARGGARCGRDGAVRRRRRRRRAGVESERAAGERLGAPRRAVAAIDAAAAADVAVATVQAARERLPELEAKAAARVVDVQLLMALRRRRPTPAASLNDGALARGERGDGGGRDGRGAARRGAQASEPEGSEEEQEVARLCARLEKFRSSPPLARAASATTPRRWQRARKLEELGYSMSKSDLKLGAFGCRTARVGDLESGPMSRPPRHDLPPARRLTRFVVPAAPRAAATCAARTTAPPEMQIFGREPPVPGPGAPAKRVAPAATKKPLLKRAKKAIVKKAPPKPKPRKAPLPKPKPAPPKPKPKAASQPHGCAAAAAVGGPPRPIRPRKSTIAEEAGRQAEGEACSRRRRPSCAEDGAAEAAAAAESVGRRRPLRPQEERGQ